MQEIEKNKDLTLRYALIQGFFWMNFAAIMGFASIYLLDVGFSNTQIGLLIAVSGIISAFLQPLIASYADRPDSPSVKRVILALSVLLVAISGCLLFVSGNLLLTAIFYGGCVTFLQILTPLVNSLGMESINQGNRLNFGISRGMGSVTYAFAAYVLGLIVARVGAITVPVSIALIFAALILALFPFPFEKKQLAQEKTDQRSSGGALYFFKRYRMFCGVLCGCILIYISHVLLNSFTFQIVESKGGGSSEMGFAMALASIIELPIMFLFGYMLKKARADFWFRVSGIFFMLKNLGTLLAPSIFSFYLVQVFQMFGWALIAVSSVYFVNSIMEEQDVIKGQAYMTMTYTLGSVLGALIGGALIDKAGVNAMLLFGTVCAFLGMTIILITAGRCKRIK